MEQKPTERSPAAVRQAAYRDGVVARLDALEKNLGDIAAALSAMVKVQSERSGKETDASR